METGDALLPSGALPVRVIRPAYREDPTQTIAAYTNIAKVILGGRVLDPADLAADQTGNLPD